MTVDASTVVWFVALVAAVILHEISHGVVALYFGDDTARRAGRLTLNPVPHIDPLGSIILPVLGALSGIPVIAWAKPVPVNPARLRNQRRDMLYVSLAGPITNFTLGIISALVARALFRDWNGPLVFRVPDDLPLSIQFPLLFAVTNFALGIFNLLPIPPLDGSSMIERVLPERWLPSWYQVRQYGIAILFLLLITGVFGRVINPLVNNVYEFVLT